MSQAALQTQSIRIKRTSFALFLSLLLAGCGGGGGGEAVPDVSAATGAGIDGGSASDGTNVATAVTEAAKPKVESNIAGMTDVGNKGRTYYVATNGSDSNNGLAPDSAFRNVEAALGLVNPGDTIEVMEGTYEPTVERGFFLRRGGTADAWIKIKPYKNQKVTLSAGGNDFVIYGMPDAPYWIIEGMELRGGNMYVVKLDNHHVHLVRNEIHGSRNDLVKLVNTADDVAIYANRLHHNNAAPGENAQGIDIVGADRTWVAHNHVHDIPSIGIYAKGNSRNTVFEHNRVVNVHMRGIMLGQATGPEFMSDGTYETYDGVIRNNVVIGTNDACLATASSYNVKIYNNSCSDVARTAHGAIYVSNESMLGQAGTNVMIKNNIIVGSARPVVKLGPGAMTDYNTLHIEKNLYWNGDAPVTFLSEDHNIWDEPVENWRAKTGKDGSSIIGSPRFKNPRSLELNPDSPAIDAGQNTAVTNEDFNHGPRPRGAGFDIGAYEAR